MDEGELVAVGGDGDAQGGGWEAERAVRRSRLRAKLRPRGAGVRDDDFVSDLVRRESEAMLRVAHRYSYCHDDAAEAYARALEILLRRAHDLDPQRAGAYLVRVVKHEALAVRRERQRERASDTAALDRQEARHLPGPDERAAGFERVARSAEALRELKPHEVTALWLLMQGLSYEEIAVRQSWSRTKVNRCITEGRRAFLARFAGIESGEECLRWEPVLSALADGEVGARELSDVRAHLRNCTGCQRRLEGICAARGPLEVVFPIGLAGTTGDQGETATNLLVRAYEALAGAMQERAAASAMKVQAAFEAASAGKVTAVAASAAALAGGGAVAVDTVDLPGGGQERAEAAAPGKERAERRSGAQEALLAAGPGLATLPPRVPAARRGGDPLVARADEARAVGAAPARAPAPKPQPRRREFAGEFDRPAQPAPTPASPASRGGGEWSGAAEFEAAPSAPATRSSTTSGGGTAEPAPSSGSSAGGSGGGSAGGSGEFDSGEFGP
ncbi:MAG: zf-HC2 domain-containing protein [Solirubrobacteraceae bacterium MAG38_C4-C5]|nr:zf-HC2 domain-containing protein [Candidatus Siliceabacter maunaloa]